MPEHVSPNRHRKVAEQQRGRTSRDSVERASRPAANMALLGLWVWRDKRRSKAWRERQE